MCRTKKKDQNDSKKESSRQDDKSTDEPNGPGVTLMVKRLIDEPELSESGLARSTGSSEPIVNSVNSYITKKILNSGATNHIFCDRSLFISYTPKISIYETGTREKC